MTCIRVTNLTHRHQRRGTNFVKLVLIKIFNNIHLLRRQIPKYDNSATTTTMPVGQNLVGVLHTEGFPANATTSPPSAAPLLR
jgi:hypothetical protein